MEQNFYAVIMAGGGGTRLWPLSRRTHPKQMLRLVGDRTLFQVAVDRLEGVFPPERIFIVTTAEQAAKLQSQYSIIPPQNYIIEPRPRGTASAVGLAALALRMRDADPRAVMAVLTADHFISNVPYFRNLLEAGSQVALGNHLVTLGIKPTFPATGYGYIQQGEWLGGYQGLSVFRVERFVEKPNEEKARAMLQQGNYYWNSGMFIWRVETILDKIHEHLPELSRALTSIQNAWNTPQHNRVLEEEWGGLKPETIDYGIMERVNDAAIIPAANLGWNDVGSWDSLFEVLPTDENGNIVINAHHVGVNTHNSLVFSEKPKHLIATLGVRNLVIVEMDDVLLICPREEAQNIKQMLTSLNEMGKADFF